MLATVHDLAEYVLCYYEDCVPAQERRRAYMSVRTDVMLAASQLWRVRAPTNMGDPLAGLGAPVAYRPPPLSFEPVRGMRRYVERAFHVSGRRTLAFADMTNMAFRNAEGELMLNGKLLELIFYTRYRRRRAESRNDVFSLRLWVSVPLTMTCDHTIARFAAKGTVQRYLAQLVERLLSLVMWPIFTVLTFDAMRCNPERPNYSECILRRGSAPTRSPLSQAYIDVIEKGFGAIPVTTDVERIESELPSTLASAEAKDLITDFIDSLPTNEIRVGCRELPPETTYFDRKARAKVIRAFQRAWLSGRCYMVSQALGAPVCDVAQEYYLFPSASQHYMRFYNVMGLRGRLLRVSQRFGAILYPYSLWAQGSLKAPLLAPTLAFIERVNFQDASLGMVFSENALQPPAELVRQIYEAAVGTLVPPRRYARIANELRTETFEPVFIPVNFYDLIGRVFFP